MYDSSFHVFSVGLFHLEYSKGELTVTPSPLALGPTRFLDHSDKISQIGLTTWN